MADFVQTMKDWRRMCMAMEKELPDDACCGCRLEGYECPAIPAIYADNCHVDFRDVEKQVSAWAAENPEPVYPTWKEWLEEQRVVVHFDSVNAKGIKVKWELTNKSNCPIPAELA